MPQDRPVPGSAEDWLTRAEGDLALARAPLPEGAFYVDAALLTSYAWEARYPGLSEPVTDEEYREAFRQAELVVRWAMEVIRD